VSAALAWIGHALDAHGEGLADGRIRVPRSQAALAEEAGCSAGTIAYYLRVLGDAVSASRRDGLVVDPRLLRDGGDELARRRRRSAEVADVLIDTWGQGTVTAAGVELADGGGRPPTVRQMAAALSLNPSTTQRHLDSLSREGRLVRHGRRLYLQAEGHPPPVRPDADGRTAAAAVGGPAPLDPQLLALLADTASALVRAAEDLAAVGRGVLDLVGRAAANPMGADGGSPRYVRAPVAAIRDCAPDVADAPSLEGSREVDRSLLPTSEPPRLSARDRDLFAGPRVEPPGPFPATPARITARSTAEDVANALLPLQRACERLSLPSVVDEKGRRWLSMLSPEELERGVTQILRQLQRGARLGAPLGLLVAKAKAADDAFFAPLPPGPSPRPALVEDDALGPVEAVDPAAAAAIAAMSPAELGHLDVAVLGRLRGVFGTRSRSIDGVIRDEQGLAQWRATVWREQQLPAEGAV
jgi:hypothetical protein